MNKDKLFVYPEPVWAGTAHSLLLAMEAEEKIMAGVFTSRAMADSEDEDQPPWNFSIVGDIGVVSIRGPLVNRDSPYNRYAGITGYPDIRRAMIYGAQQAGVKAILLDIHSGGGDVSGVADTGDLIASIDKGVKPVYAYTEGTMASAAYWIGVSAREVYSSKTSLVGSIGVLATHMEYSKALKEAGVGVTVVRHGEFKALLNSFEPATKEALAQLAGQLAAAYGVFIGHVASSLGMSVEQADAKVGQGREFFGDQAVQAGLSRGIESFDSMIGKIGAKLAATSGMTHSNIGKHTGLPMPKQALTAQEIAALASGAPNQEARTPEQIAADEAAAAAQAAAQAATEAATEAAAATAAAATAAAAAQQVTKPEEGQQAVLAYVQGQLTAANAALAAANVELATLKAAHAAMKVNHDALLSIAAASATNMRVALRLAPVDMSAMSAEGVLAEHASSVAAFTKTFPVGGVAATTKPGAGDEKPEADPHYKARIAATRF